MMRGTTPALCPSPYSVTCDTGYQFKLSRGYFTYLFTPFSVAKRGLTNRENTPCDFEVSIGLSDKNHAKIDAKPSSFLDNRVENMCGNGLRLFLVDTEDVC